MQNYEKVNRPDHYQAAGMEVIDVIQAFNLNFALGNVVKYTLRAGKKPAESRLDDLQKAARYIQYEIEAAQKELPSEEGVLDLAVIGSKMPEGFTQMSPETLTGLKGLAAYNACAYVHDAPVSNTAQLFDTVCDALLKSLAKIKVDEEDDAFITELVDKLLEAQLSIAFK